MKLKFTREVTNWDANFSDQIAASQDKWLTEVENYVSTNECLPRPEDGQLYYRMSKIKSARSKYFSQPFRDEVEDLFPDRNGKLREGVLTRLTTNSVSSSEELSLSNKQQNEKERFRKENMSHEPNFYNEYEKTNVTVYSMAIGMIVFISFGVWLIEQMMKG
jgi:hypothetical protein